MHKERHPLGTLQHRLHCTYQIFTEKRCAESASALTFDTLLALVPLMTVTFTLLSAFPKFRDLGEKVRSYVFNHFVPESATVVLDYLHRFSDNAAGLTAAGLTFLIITSLMLIANIDQVFNRIWNTKPHQKLSQRVINYWTVLTMTPLFMGLSVTITSFVMGHTLPEQAPILLQLSVWFWRLLPFLLSVIGFTLLYVVVPNWPVQFKHALSGAVAAAMMFEGTKQGFAYYVALFPNIKAIYGAFAALPLFFVWIYLCWIITLLGAVLARVLDGCQRSMSPFEREQMQLIIACRLIGHLYQARDQGNPLSLGQLRRLEQHQVGESIWHVLKRLEKIKIVHQTHEGAWALSRNPAKVTLWELVESGHFSLPRMGNWHQKDDWNGRLGNMILPLETSIKKGLSQPIVRLYESDSDKEKSNHKGWVA